MRFLRLLLVLGGIVVVPSALVRLLLLPLRRMCELRNLSFAFSQTETENSPCGTHRTPCLARPPKVDRICLMTAPPEIVLLAIVDCPSCVNLSGRSVWLKSSDRSW